MNICNIYACRELFIDKKAGSVYSFYEHVGICSLVAMVMCSSGGLKKFKVNSV